MTPPRPTLRSAAIMLWILLPAAAALREVAARAAPLVELETRGVPGTLGRRGGPLRKVYRLRR